MYIYSENIYTPDGFQEGYLKIENGIIEGIYPNPENNEGIISYGQNIVLPGFIDIHLHGWGTGSFTGQGTEESLKNMSRDLVKVGVTSYLATSGTESLDYLNFQLKEARNAINNWQAHMGAEILGLHLEGPFVNKEYKGMMKEEYFINPSIEIFHNFLDIGGEENIKLITMAPELPNSEEFIKYVNKKSIQISIGHSAAEFEDIQRLKDFGLGGFTHTYSGMKGFHHRRLGVVGAAMYFEDMYAEFAKQTGMTVKPEAFEIMYRLKKPEKIILTTDCVGLAHMSNEFYHYIRKQSFIPQGDYIKVVNEDGSYELVDKYNYEEVKNLELSYLESVKNVIKNVGASVKDIAKMTSENPAKYIGIYRKKGSLEKGKDGDIIVIDDEWNLIDVYVNGIKQNIN